MANIVIKDLSENSELDRQAMLAIAGGSRTGGRLASARPTAARRVPSLFGGSGYAHPAADEPPPPSFFLVR